MTTQAVGRSMHWRIRAATIGVALIAGVWALMPSAAPAPGECRSGDWPAFSLAYARNNGGSSDGRILWCNSSNWTLDRFGAVQAGEATQERAAGDIPAAIFSWFSPRLSPEQAMRRAVPDARIRDVPPRHPLAAVAYTARVDNGELRMEFSVEGIPVALLPPEGSDYHDWFWVTTLDRANRTVRSDEDLMNRPSCASPQAAMLSNVPCWDESGRLWDGNCWSTLADETAEFILPACSL